MTDDRHTLENNLAALGRTHYALAERLAQTAPAALEWTTTKSGDLSAAVLHDGKPRQLASRFDPRKEAAQLIEPVDFERNACVIVLGFGLGYHVEEVVREIGEKGFSLVYEPDIAVLRAVFERRDLRQLFTSQRMILCDDTIDRSTLTRYFDGFNAVIAQGTQLVTHPPTRAMHAEAFAEFSRLVTDTLAYCRTTLATTLVNASRTVGNLLGNLPFYAAGESINDLRNAAKGATAVCVSAGPSLARNIDLLRERRWRDNVVVIAAQTALRPLLDRGVEPDFVTALDYSAVSRRFYENLPPLPNVTLIAEPKAHPVILDSFPGPVRVTQCDINDIVLGKLVRPMAGLPAGGTVAHLSFYVAQFLGCDPIVLIGQDLGFSDGLYYVPGTAVHEVWDCELNRFNTIEMMEWQRVVRHRSHLSRHEDIHGRPIFSDEQMTTYLKQFERDFKQASQRIIDATEGGMPKAHAETMTLREALEQFAITSRPALPKTQAKLDPTRLSQSVGEVQHRLDEVRDLHRSSVEAQDILEQMKRNQQDRAKMQRLFERMQKTQRHVADDLGRAFYLVSQINAVGSFRRIKTDRINARKQAAGVDKQLLQIERDMDNLKWIIQSCDEAVTVLDEALRAMRQRVGRKPREVQHV